MKVYLLKGVKARVLIVLIMFYMTTVTSRSAERLTCYITTIGLNYVTNHGVVLYYSQTSWTFTTSRKTVINMTPQSC